MSILLIDDSPDARLLIQGMLKEAGYREVVSVRSACEAYERLGIDPPRVTALPIDLILMDITMPHTDGLEACRRIKATDRLRDIPIIMVTVREKTAFLQKAFEAGANDYVSKPVDRVELLARVRSAMKLKQEIDARKS